MVETEWELNERRVQGTSPAKLLIWKSLNTAFIVVYFYVSFVFPYFVYYFFLPYGIELQFEIREFRSCSNIFNLGNWYSKDVICCKFAYVSGFQDTILLCKFLDQGFGLPLIYQENVIYSSIYLTVADRRAYWLGYSNVVSFYWRCHLRNSDKRKDGQDGDQIAWVSEFQS